MDDRSLFEAWQAGDRDAGQALIERHFDAVLRFFQTKAGADAEDLVQRTFLACVEGGARFRGSSSFRAFLFGIARNVLLEHIRARTKARLVDDDFAVSSVIALQPGVSTLAFQRAEQRLLVQALQRIPLDLQLGLELHYWEDLSVAELAEVLGIPGGYGEESLVPRARRAEGRHGEPAHGDGGRARQLAGAPPVLARRDDGASTERCPRIAGAPTQVAWRSRPRSAARRSVSAFRCGPVRKSCRRSGSSSVAAR